MIPCDQCHNAPAADPPTRRGRYLCERCRRINERHNTRMRLRDERRMQKTAAAWAEHATAAPTKEIDG